MTSVLRPMPWFQVEELERQGLSVVNDGTKGDTHGDRRLYTGDIPRARDELARLAADRDLTPETVRATSMCET